MRLLSFHADGRDRFGLVTDAGVIDLGARLPAASLRALLESDGLGDASRFARGTPADFALDEIGFLPPIPSPGKILCIGVNYRERNAEYRDGSEAPKYPSVFMRTAESLVGHGQPIARPPESEQLDYEGEIVLVIGKAGRRIARERAFEHVAGVSLMNEGTVRDWLRHAKFNVTQGKNFERSGSWGPWIVTTDALGAGTPGTGALGAGAVGAGALGAGAPCLALPLQLTTHVNGDLRQDDTTANLIFPFDYLISYLSSFLPLKPGDIIATGTPTGAGARFDPPKYLRSGDVVRVHTPQIGTLENRVEDETPSP